MVEYYDEIQIGECDDGEPIYIRITGVTTTPTFGKETRATIHGTIK